MKISILGTGHVGSTLAFTIVLKSLCDELILVNRTRRKAEGDAADLQHASAFAAQPVEIRAGDIEDTTGSDIVVLTLSVPAPADITRDRNDLAVGNCELLTSIVPHLAELSPECVMLVVTNPVDPMTYLVQRLSQFPTTRVIGTGTLIDSARFRSYLSQDLRIHPDDIRAYVLGEHGRTQFPALSIAATGGQRLDHEPRIQESFDRTISSAFEIFQIKGYTNYAISLAASLIIEAIESDSHRTLPVSTMLNGFEEQYDVCLSVPAVIGRQGVVRQLNPKLSPEESKMFRDSATAVRQVIEQLEIV